MTLSISAGVGSDIGLHPVPQTPFEAPAPNRKWIADFTYVWTAEGWLYVAVVIDLFSRRVVGWSMSAEMTAQLVTDALRYRLRSQRSEWFSSPAERRELL